MKKYTDVIILNLRFKLDLLRKSCERLLSCEDMPFSKNWGKFTNAWLWLDFLYR